MRGTFDWTPISREEGISLRGWAILAIVLHNFTHWVEATPGENEFTFDPVRVELFMQGLATAPLDVFRLFFSFLGHYGVQIFVFLSGYGLFRKYRDSLPGVWAFFGSRLLALYPAVALAALAYFGYETFRTGFAEVAKTTIPLLGQATGVSNFHSGWVHKPIGPWWFLSLVLQFYLLFPWLRRAAAESLSRLAVIGGSALLLEVVANSYCRSQLGFNLNHTVVGHLPVFCLGMAMARIERLPVAAYGMVAAFGLFVLGQFAEQAWWFSGLVLILWAVPAIRWLEGRLPKRVTAVFAFLGRISLPLFLVNGFFRNPFVYFAQEAGNPGATIGWCAVFLGLSVFVASVCAALEKRLRSRLGCGHSRTDG